MRSTGFDYLQHVAKSLKDINAERADEVKHVALAKATNSAGCGGACRCSSRARELVLRAEAQKTELLRRSRGV